MIRYEIVALVIGFIAGVVTTLVIGTATYIDDEQGPRWPELSTVQAGH